MKIYGRITIYGEYLMHDNEQGLIMPSNLYLETTDNKDYKSEYNKELDKVLISLKDKGIIPSHTLKGNLPLGYGLAGSTILGFLHLSHIENIIIKKNIINEIDTKMHGFTPSGLDFESCVHQQWGLFCSKYGWKSQAPSLIDYSIIIFPKEQKMPLNKIQERVLSERRLLVPIQKELNEIVKRHNIVNLELLMEYAKILSSIGVYSEVANEFVDNVLKQGYIAKGIGGLYDKAVIVIHNRNKENNSDIESLELPTLGRVVANLRHM